MIRSRRNIMFAWRSPSEPTGRRLSGYLAAMQFTIAGPLPRAHDPPPPGGVGVGGAGGAGAGGAGVRNDCVTLHPLVVSPSLARARQYAVTPCVSGELLNVVWPDPPETMPAAISLLNA